MDAIKKDVSVLKKELTIMVDYVQGTNGIPILFNIVDYSIPSGATANIYIKKPSGKQIYNSCTISEQVITVQPTTQMFAESGKQFGQLQILQGESIVESFLVLFDVERSIVDDSAIESSDEFTALEDALNSIDDATTEAENAVSAANQAVSDAQTAIKNANTAINGANAAASSANSAAEAATNAASAANTAAEGANTAAQNANEKASAANSAAEAANNAVDALEEALQGTVINDNSVSNLTTYSSQKIEGEFDDVNEVIYEIGGRNFIQQKFFNEEPWDTAILEKETIYKDKSCMHISHSALFVNASNGAESIFPDLTFKENTQYTLRVEWCATTSSSGIIGQMMLRFKYTDGTYSGIANTSDDWEISTLVSKKGKTVSKIISSYNTLASGTYIANMKLEVGDTATRWTPAPEDIENEIDGKLSSTGDGSSLTVDFTESASVADITSGSTLAVLFGQILKNQNDFLDADTIQAAEDAGITGETGIALLNSVLQKTLINPIIEEYDSGGYHIRKYANGYMFATGSSSLGPTWTPVGASTGFATASKELTIPDMTEAVIGFANLTQSSVYIFSPTIVVIGGKATLQSHRLSTSNASFTFNVAVLGKWK